jgi:hypothetical protein
MVASTKSKTAKEAAVEAKIEAKIADLKLEALEEVDRDEDLFEQNRQEWANRYRCKIVEVSRKGAKNHEMYVSHPKNPHKPYRLNIKLGHWIEEGLPMGILRRLQKSYDTGAEQKDISEMTGSAGTEHRMNQTPRFAVQIGKLVKPKEEK